MNIIHKKMLLEEITIFLIFDLNEPTPMFESNEHSPDEIPLNENKFFTFHLV